MQNHPINLLFVVRLPTHSSPPHSLSLYTICKFINMYLLSVLVTLNELSIQKKIVTIMMIKKKRQKTTDHTSWIMFTEAGVCRHLATDYRLTLVSEERRSIDGRSIYISIDT